MSGAAPTAEARAARRRQRWGQNAVLLAIAVAASLCLYLFFGPAPAPDPPLDLNPLRHVDGTLSVVEDTRLVMKPFAPLDGRPGEVTFTVRPRDADSFDIAHMQSHSSVALPTRIYFERAGSRYFARYKEDAPVNSNDG
jgi:hypothetical protein